MLECAELIGREVEIQTSGLSLHPDVVAPTGAEWCGVLVVALHTLYLHTLYLQERQDHRTHAARHNNDKLCAPTCWKFDA